MPSNRRNFHGFAGPGNRARTPAMSAPFAEPAPRPGTRRRNRGRPGEAGFTLLEILVVVAILGLLITLVAPRVLRLLGGARVSVAGQAIQRLGSVLDIYKLDTGSYPNTEQGIDALLHRPSGVGTWNGPYLQANTLPVDPWNHPYIYREPSARPGHDYDLCSRGPNGASGDPGAAGLICNP